jgi:hypothetical protein
MSRALFIVGIVFAVVFMVVTGYYAEEVQSARWYDYDFYDYGYSDYNYSSYSSHNSADDLTVEAGLWSLFFILAFTTIHILGLIKVKTKTMKVFAILGICFCGIFLLWDALMVIDPGAIDFDEVAPAWILFCLIMLAFTIVGLVQSVRFIKIEQRGSLADLNSGANDLLD